MELHAILKPVGIDLKRLPLDALEGFVLSQIDGQLDLEGLAEVTGLVSHEVVRIAERLLELGAVSIDGATRRKIARVDPRAEKASLRPDPRAEKTSRRPGPRAEATSVRSDPRAERHSVRPATVKPKPPLTPQPAPRRSRKSLPMQRVAPPREQPVAAQEACELDEATLGAIVALDAKLGTVDHYVLLELERDADKKTIKRSYFAFAARFHPDRFFGKKLGTARARIDRIFHRVTEAHDTLTNSKRRAEYDETLPAPPAAARVSKAPAAKLSRKMSKAMRAASRQMKAVPAPSIEPAAPPVERAPAEVAPVSVSSPTSEDRKRDLRAGAMEVMVQQRVDLLVKAAEDALGGNDVIGAANNFRLALEHRDDPRIRMLFEDVDARARALRFEKNIAPARAAERDERWADAAVFLVRAHDAKADCDVASRAARALRLSGGDLERAAALAEEAVALAPRNAAYRITLAEIYLVANRPDCAEDECATARALAPKDERVKALAAEITKKAKAKA